GIFDYSGSFLRWGRSCLSTVFEVDGLVLRDCCVLKVCCVRRGSRYRFTSWVAGIRLPRPCFDRFLHIGVDIEWWF
ncbi:MAG: hypothetical protein P8176_12065, partial [Gammaproteobacteria bacterium]